eukprot:jgi/Bigna1/79585/fgenesh1_pg.63_\
MALAKDVSNAAGYGAVFLALWYGYTMTSNFYNFFHPEVCKYGSDPQLCVSPLVTPDQKYRLEIHLAKELPIQGKLGKPVYSLGYDDGGWMGAHDTIATEINVPVKKYRLHRNKTLFAVAVAEILAPSDEDGDGIKEGGKKKKKKKTKKNGNVQSSQLVSHWNGNLSLHLVVDTTVYPRHGTPPDVVPFYQISSLFCTKTQKALPA